MAEWSNAHDWKSCVGASQPGVRIPPPPPVFFARETADTIEAAAQYSRQGTSIANAVSQEFAQIVLKVRGVDAIVAQLASVSQEQSEGLNQINLALNEIDKVTQNIAAGTEESAAAAEQLSAQSTELSASATQLSTLIGVRAASERTDALKGLIQSPPRRAAPEPR